MKMIWKVLAVTGAVATVGTAVFLYSRPAAAAAAGAKAFRVSADCLLVEIIDEEAGRTALEAAGLASFKTMDERADNFFVRVVSYATSCPVSDAMKITGIPGVPFGVTVGQVKAMIGDRTLEQVAELAAKGELPGIPGLEGAALPIRIIPVGAGFMYEFTDGTPTPTQRRVASEDEAYAAGAAMLQSLSRIHPINAMLRLATGGDY